MEAIIQEQGRTIGLQIDESRDLGRGATARVCSVVTPGFEDRLAKLYRDPGKINEPKLEAMLENPPSGIFIEVSGVRYPQYAWPTHLLHSQNGRLIGYLMPRIDEHLSLTLDFFYDHHLLTSHGMREERSLTFKLQIGRNLCAMLAELHAHGHCFIDFKPQNIKVFQGSHIVALLDCDSYRIASKAMRFFPATNFTSEYIAPEGLRSKLGPQMLSEPQDRFALAVVLFQLLNNGIHPFQGIQVNSVEFASTDEKVREGFYPYGAASHAAIRPPPQSVHTCFDDTSRALFDRAFTAQSSFERPSALEWREHFDRILDDTGLDRCDRHPNDPVHIHFPGKKCGTCHFDGAIADARKKQGRVFSPRHVAARWRLDWVLALIFIIGFLAYMANRPDGRQAALPSIQAALPSITELGRINDRFSTPVMLRRQPKLKAPNQSCCLARGAVVRLDGTTRAHDANSGIDFLRVFVSLPDRDESGWKSGWISARAVDEFQGMEDRAWAPQKCEDPDSQFCKEPSR